MTSQIVQVYAQPVYQKGNKVFTSSGVEVTNPVRFTSGVVTPYQWIETDKDGNDTPMELAFDQTRDVKIGYNKVGWFDIVYNSTDPSIEGISTVNQLADLVDDGKLNNSFHPGQQTASQYLQSVLVNGHYGGTGFVISEKGTEDAVMEYLANNGWLGIDTLAGRQFNTAEVFGNYLSDFFTSGKDKYEGTLFLHNGILLMAMAGSGYLNLGTGQTSSAPYLQNNMPAQFSPSVYQPAQQKSSP